MTDIPWGTIRALPVCQLIIKGRYKPKGLWYRSGDHAACTHGPRIYQESYEGTWVSYPASKRAAKVSNYQFRAPGEWFAELYALYYLDKLKDTHPDYKWFKKEVADKA